jgi:hypothetical protein
VYGNDEDAVFTSAAWRLDVIFGRRLEGVALEMAREDWVPRRVRRGKGSEGKM